MKRGKVSELGMNPGIKGDEKGMRIGMSPVWDCRRSKDHSRSRLIFNL